MVTTHSVITGLSTNESNVKITFLIGAASVTGVFFIRNETR